MTPPTTGWLDIDAAAAYLGISVRSVYRLLADPGIDLHLYTISGMSRNNRRLKQAELSALLVQTEAGTR